MYKDCDSLEIDRIKNKLIEYRIKWLLRRENSTCVCFVILNNFDNNNLKCELEKHFIRLLTLKNTDFNYQAIEEKK